MIGNAAANGVPAPSTIAAARPGDPLFVGADDDRGGPNVFAQALGENDLDSSHRLLGFGRCSRLRRAAALRARCALRYPIFVERRTVGDVECEGTGAGGSGNFMCKLAGGVSPRPEADKEDGRKAVRVKMKSANQPQTARLSRSHVWNALIIARDGGGQFISSLAGVRIPVSLRVAGCLQSLHRGHGGDTGNTGKNPFPGPIAEVFHPTPSHVFCLARMARSAHSIHYVVEEKLAVSRNRS